jgi:hypothetical protein
MKNSWQSLPLNQCGVWNNKTRDPLRESAAQFQDVVQLATKRKTVE